MISVRDITDMQRDTVAKWHEQDISNPFDGILEVACTQHTFNFRLWHQEDIARAVDVADSRIAEVKRAIDGLNQNRNDWIEKLDDWISQKIEEAGVNVAAEAPLNTETPGSVMDRLSILALRIYHLEEQARRSDATTDHVESVQRKLAVCLVQFDDLSNSLQELLDDIWAGRKRHRTYRQFKMYNDPALNPYLYEAKNRLAS
jgi:cell division protein FtsB